MHFEQAGETDKAIDYHASGAQHAIDQNALREAFAAFDRAAACSPRAAARRRGAREAGAGTVEVLLGRVAPATFLAR